MTNLFKEIAVRWLFFVTMFALSSGGVGASDAPASEGQGVEVVTSVAGADAAVVVTPIPLPASATTLLKELKPSRELRAAKRVKVASKKSIPKSMLSRTERHQIALLAARHNKDEGSLVDIANDEDVGTGAEVLDLQRSFSRPRVAKSAVSDDDDDDDLVLSDAVKLRLLLARMKAVRAHQNKFS